MGVFFAAARLTEYAMATACLTGFPAFTSVRMFLLNAGFDVDLVNGIS
jgi:hypothetical protein